MGKNNLVHAFQKALAKLCKLPNKAYARIELLGDMDRYETILKSIEALSEPKEKLRPVAQNYKSMLYGNS